MQPQSFDVIQFSPNDIRAQSDLDHNDVNRLNFIRPATGYRFRRHFNQGLRSHIIEVIRECDAINEAQGINCQGMRVFPRARPVKMLRIFKRRFNDLSDLETETRRIRCMGRYIPERFMAVSAEFVVDYHVDGQWDMMLCGLQDFVDGPVVDPWRPDSLPPVTHAHAFIRAVFDMIEARGLIPDLAGIGNLRTDSQGLLKLIDINNINPLTVDAQIHLDDQGYPTADKSLQALALLERHLTDRQTIACHPITRFLLEPNRLAAVNQYEKRFYKQMK